MTNMVYIPLFVIYHGKGLYCMYILFRTRGHNSECTCTSCVWPVNLLPVVLGDVLS